MPLSAFPTLTLIVDARGQELTRLHQLTAACATAALACDRLLMLTTEPRLTETTIAVPYASAGVPVQWLCAETGALHREILPQIHTEQVAFLPPGADLSPHRPCLHATPAIAPWLSSVCLPLFTATEWDPPIAWLASTPLFRQALPWLHTPADWTLLNLGRILERQQIPFVWQSGLTAATPAAAPTLGDNSVLAIVPHYRCEPWLPQCLRSLVAQTRPLDGIVVVDDGSAVPPIDLVQQFPSVTLLAAATACPVGPYRLVQQVIQMTDYWGYLFQDADDWSSCDRLQQLLALVTATAAALVGTQEIRVYAEPTPTEPIPTKPIPTEPTMTELIPTEPTTEPTTAAQEKLSLVGYPLDVNTALVNRPGHGLLHPTSLVTRDLVIRLGGFATGLQFGGDTEFLYRAALAATVRNSPQFCYYRRKRSHSLTTAPATGLDSPARQQLQQQLKAIATQNYAAVAAGQAPNLDPLLTAAPVSLRHLAGPPLKWHSI